MTGSPARAGFTVVEVLVVLVLLSIVAAVATPAFTSVARADDLERAAEELRMLLERGRATSLENGTPVLLVLDSRTGRWWIRSTTSEGLTHFADSGRLSLASEIALQSHAHRPAVRFLPSGAAHGAPITLRDGQRLVTLHPDPWTGIVEASHGTRASAIRDRGIHAR